MTNQTFDPALAAEAVAAETLPETMPETMSGGETGAGTVPESPPAAPVRDHEIWALTHRVEQLHRASTALHGLIARTQAGADAVTVTPRVARRVRPDPSDQPPRRAPAASDTPWWPTARLPDLPMQPPPGFANFSAGIVPLPAIAFNTAGLAGRDLDHAVSLIVEEQTNSAAFKPVILTDARDFTPMVRRGLVVEHLQPGDLDPGAEEGIRPGLRAFLVRKWGLVRHVDMRAVRAPLDSPVPTPPAALAAPTAPRPPVRRKKVAVVSWDLCHNPVGRAMVIHDLLAQDHEVELVGPMWKRFGGRLWEPIAGSDRKVRGIPCETLEDFWPAALAFASAAVYDLVVVCKPRLPALVLGALLKKTCGCPLVLDVDDFELSFFPDETAASLAELSSAGPVALCEPYGELATRACEGLIPEADAVIVSNVALRRRYGGTIVRHARDEQAFLDSRFDRAEERRRMGMAPEDFALVFVGTARAHKGVFDIARTLAELPDKRFVLHLVGDIPDRRVRNELDRHKGARIVYHPNCPFEALPARIVAADAVVLLQDAGHPISQYQIPAKVSDASAFGLPILATDVPPLRDLAAQGVVTTIAPSDLASALQSLLTAREGGRDPAARQRVREAFEAELGFRINRERLSFAIARASLAAPGLPQGLDRLIEITDAAWRALRTPPPALGPPALRSPAPSLPASARPAFDLVMFWKQNDTGIYGRRSDMVMKHLLASGRVGRILQFDAPLEVTQLAQSAEAESAAAARAILCNTIANQHALRDSDRHRLRTYLWDRRGRTPVLPRMGRSLADYPAFVEAEMAAAGMRPETTLAWVCPVVFDFPAIAARIGFRARIGDLIDDQRQFEMSPAYRDKVVASYEATLPLLDLAFTNCDPVAEAFAGMTRRIAVVPNGTELVPDDPGPPPAALASLPRPLAGYVGNLRDRFDWPLLRDTALRLPHVNFAIIGGGARARDVALVEGLPNIHFLGVVPHDLVPACIRAFDVALVPHTCDVLTDRMNPLKIYNYFAAGRPIVSTPVDNVDPGIRPFIRFAPDPDGFAAAITASLSGAEIAGDRAAVLSTITWEARVARILAEIDAMPGLAP